MNECFRGICVRSGIVGNNCRLCASAYDIEAINSLVAPEITNTTYSQCINVASKWIVVEDWLDHPLINIDHGEYDGSVVGDVKIVLPTIVFLSLSVPLKTI